MSETTMTAGVHLRNYGPCTIECYTAKISSRPTGYAVLNIGPVSFWPSTRQLRALHRVIGQWLASPEGQAVDDAESDLASGHVPAETD